MIEADSTRKALCPPRNALLAWSIGNRLVKYLLKAFFHSQERSAEFDEELTVKRAGL